MENAETAMRDPVYLHTRREPFDYGLLPIPKLIFSDGATTLGSLKDKLIQRSSSFLRVDSATISETLQISLDDARRVLDTVAAVLHSDSDPLVSAKPDEIDDVGVNVFDLILFLYIQSYKRLLPRTHKDSASVADVWPSTSAFDGYLSALSPLQDIRSLAHIMVGDRIILNKGPLGLVQATAMPIAYAEKERSLVSINSKENSGIYAFHSVIMSNNCGRYSHTFKHPVGNEHEWLVRSNSRKFMPSQADEEAHQLSYLQKHLANILSLLAEPVEGKGDESLVLPMENFEHLGFLIQFGERGSRGIPLSQAAPFFANSDPDMPAAPVSAAQVHEWLLQSIADAMEHITDRASVKQNGPSSASSSDQDVPMIDANTSSAKSSSSTRGLTFIEGISKSSFVKQAADLKGSSMKVVNCHDSVIYILAPLRYATVYGCSDATVILGAVGKAVRVEHCERVHVITAAKRICIANCRECVFFLGVNQRPVIVGDNHKLQVAPYNTFYPQLEEHLTQTGVETSVNRWDEPLALGVIDPHDSLSHPAGVSDVQAETAARLDPDQFTNFLIPNWFTGESPGSTKDNPFPLPEVYMASQLRNHNNLGEIKQVLGETSLDDGKKRELSSALHVYFKDWLYASGNIRQLYCLQND